MNLRRKLLLILAGVGGIVLIGGFCLLLYVPSEPEIQILGAEVAEEGELVVDIGGAVNDPGVYRFTYGSRIIDAIEKAGGFSDDVDIEWVDRNLNKSERLKDGIKLYIPAISDNKSSSNLVSGSPDVNINTATLATLEGLKGIGAVTAQKIVDSRPYSRVEELLERKILNKKVFEGIRSQIRI